MFRNQAHSTISIIKIESVYD